MRVNFALYLLNIFVIIQVYSILNEDEIIDRINEVRRTATPSGSDLRKVEWDDCLARITRDYIKTCPRETKNPNLQQQAENAGCVESGQTVGETTFYTEPSDGVFNSVKAIDAWAMFGAIYNLEDNFCAGVCDEYKQLVQADLYRVGCAEIDETNCNGGGNRVICNFGSASGEGRPYTAGSVSCVNCEGEWAGVCDEGLCVRSQEPTSSTVTVTTTRSIPATTSTIPPTKSSKETTHTHHHHHFHTHEPDHTHGSHDHKDKDDSKDHSHGSHGHKDGDGSKDHSHGSHSHKDGDDSNDHSHESHDHDDYEDCYDHTHETQDHSHELNDHTHESDSQRTQDHSHEPSDHTHALDVATKSHDHSKGPKSHDRGSKGPKSHDRGSKGPKSHDHSKGHKSHDHNHGDKNHDHNDNNNNHGKGRKFGAQSLSQSNATNNKSIGVLLIVVVAAIIAFIF